MGGESMKRLAFACTIATAAMLGTAAQAEPIMLDFVGKTVQSTTPYMTGEADGVFHLVSKWMPLEAPGTPLDGATGECFGAAAMVAGKMTGDGYCVYRDAGGDSITLRWWMANAAAPRGYWQFTGGTGMWAGAVGGGQWVDTPGEAENTGLSHVTGSVEFQ